MLLLNGHSLTASRKVPLNAMSLQLNERESSASITPSDMTGITVNSWFQDETDPGKGIVWRVRSIRQTYGTKTTVVQLEHAISVLKDRILFGEVKTETMAGKKGATKCTAAQAIGYILSKQSDWALGTVDYNVSNPYKFDGDTLFDALETVSNSLKDCWWSYDFSTYPFKISFKKKSDSIGTIMRAGRNMTAISKSIDKSGMYTRHYPIGKNDMKLDGAGYVERNTDKYGIICKTETDQTIDTVAELKRWSNERLDIHAEPVVTVDVEGVELAEQTGEPLDKIVLGRKCYVPLPEFDTEILETVTALNYPDKLFKPTVFRATLANSRNDITKIISNAMKTGGRSGRASAKKNKEDYAWFEDTNTHVAMCAKGIIGVDAQGNPNWTRLSQIYVDGNGISQTVETVKKGQSEMKSSIEQHEDYIKQTVEAVGADGKITAASITTAINEGGSAVVIEADHIKLNGTKISLNDVMSIKQKSVYISKPMRVTGDVMAASVTLRDLDGGSSFTLNESNVTSIIKSVQIAGPTNNIYTLQYKKMRDTNWSDAGTFSRAVSSFVVGGGNGKVNVTALPQNQTKSVNISVDGYATILANGTYTFRALYENNDGDDVPTGATKSVTVNVNQYPNSVTVTRAKAGRTSGGLDYYQGTLYYKDEDDDSYVAAASGSNFWYYSSSNLPGTTTLHY